MKPFITTVVLLIAAVVVTVVYFRSINSPASHTAELLNSIPADASLVAELDNDDAFYDAFSGSKLLTSVAGKDKSAELDSLRTSLLENPSLKQAFVNQHIFISVHPSDTNQLEFLVTTSASAEDFTDKDIQQNTAFKSTATKIGNQAIYQLNVPGIQRPFFIAISPKKVISASFSKDLVEKSLAYQSQKNHPQAFLQLPEQQHNNSLALLYINYDKLQPLFQQLFINKNPDFFRAFRFLRAKAGLSLNYHNDALMFNGITDIDRHGPVSYLNLFTGQQPVTNDLKNIFPASTAYSICFAISNPHKFTSDLAEWHKQSGDNGKKEQLLKQIKSETGINLLHEFNTYLGNEFAVITTRYQEKLAIVEVSNGQMLFPALMNISNMVSDDIGQFNYGKLPFYLLGDAFGIFNKPYFTIINNYLVLANSQTELRAYIESYTNQKFLSKTTAFIDFDNLLAEKSNVAFFVNFKNVKNVFRRDLKPDFYQSFDKDEPGFKNYYGASYQLSSSDHNYYTNFCMQLAKTDSTTTDK